MKNRTASEIEIAVVEMVIQQPAYGQVRVANEEGPSGAYRFPRPGYGSVWQRHELSGDEKAPQGARGHVAQEGIILSEAQVVALDKAKTEKEVHGELEREHPGYCEAQDTFYVGNMKGVGRIFQQSLKDTYEPNWP